MFPAVSIHKVAAFGWRSVLQQHKRQQMMCQSGRKSIGGDDTFPGMWTQYTPKLGTVTVWAGREYLIHDNDFQERLQRWSPWSLQWGPEAAAVKASTRSVPEESGASWLSKVTNRAVRCYYVAGINLRLITLQVNNRQESVSFWVWKL